MKNCIVWSTSNHKLVAEIYWELYEPPYILTTFSEISYDYYYDRDLFPEFLKGLYGVPKLDHIWKIEPLLRYKKTNWNLYRPVNLESFIDLLRIMNNSEDTILLFSKDLDTDKLKSWIETREQEQLNTNKVFVPEIDFAKKAKLITSFSQSTILHGFLSYYDNYDYLIVSKGTSDLEQIMQSAEQAGEPRLPDYSDSLTFKKTFDDTAIFFTDLDLVIKNREGVNFTV